MIEQDAFDLARGDLVAADFDQLFFAVDDVPEFVFGGSIWEKSCQLTSSASCQQAHFFRKRTSNIPRMEKPIPIPIASISSRIQIIALRNERSSDTQFAPYIEVGDIIPVVVAELGVHVGQHLPD